MKKIYKFLILLILPILILCGIVVPTYCADISTLYYSLNPISIGDIDNYGDNYYNGQNLNYVYLENFNFIPSSTGSKRAIYFETSTSISSLYNIDPISYSEDIYFNYYGEKYLIGTLNRDFYSTYDGGKFIIYVSNFDYIPNLSLDYSNCKLGLSNEDWSNISIKISSFPFSYYTQYFTSITTFKNVWFYLPISIQFDINFTNQYYYNNMFGFTFGYNEPYNYFFIDGSGVPNSFNQFFEITDIKGNTFKYSNTNYDYGTVSTDKIYLLNNNFNSENVLYKTIYCGNVHGNFWLGDISSNYFMDDSYSNHTYTFSHSATDYTDGDNSSTLYSFNSSGQNSINSSLIPNGSNNFYKSSEWWDVPTHLYNFLIYIIFDAPIISDFTRLAYVIIQFIVSVFEWVIALFNGVSSSFFIAIFVGFIVLMFLLKIIFKG